MPEINVGINSSGAEAGSKRVQTALGNISKSASSMSSSISSMNSTLIAGLTGFVTAQAGMKLIDTSDAYVNMNSQLKYLTGNSKLAEFAQEDLYKMSQKTGTSMTDNAKALSRFALASEMTGLTMQQNIQVLGAINTMMIKTGTSSSEAGAAMMQLGQALASGKLSGDEFRSMAENAPGVVNELARVLGVTRGELRKMSEEGKLTSNVIGQAFLTMSASAVANADTLPLTWGRMWEKVVNSAERAWDKISDETGIMAWLSQSLDELAGWIEQNTGTFVNFFVELGKSITDSWPQVKQSISDVGAALAETFGIITGGSALTIPNVFAAMVNGINNVNNALLAVINSFNWIISRAGEIKNAVTFDGLWFNASELGSEPNINPNTGRPMEGSSNNKNSYGTEYTGWDDGFSGLKASKKASVGTTQNLYFNGQYSRSDVTNISLDLARQGARL